MKTVRKNIGYEKKVVSLEKLLPSIEQIVKDQSQILNGRDIAQIDLRPRELLALFLICAVSEKYGVRKLSIARDYEGRDGVLVDSTDAVRLKTEHVMVSKHDQLSIQDAIISAIGSKIAKGEAYCKTRSLIVLMERDEEELYLDRVEEYVATAINGFDSYWVIGLMNYNPKYQYFVRIVGSKFDEKQTFKVTFEKDFRSWEVESLSYQ